MSLAIEYRPRTLDEVVGNRATVKALDAVLSRDRGNIQHAFLFTGPSGCGKTTLARIVAERLGATEENYCEVDSADFRGIDTIREIRRNMMFKPMGGGPCRVWLLDECHQLSKDGQNALLKALEDTPDHVYFLLATTDPEKLLGTIRGRCATFEVSPLDEDDMVPFLREIAGSERKRIPPDIIKQIAQDSMGSCRNALQILDKIIDLPPEDMKEAAEQQAQQANAVIDLCRALMRREKWTDVAKIIKGLEKEDPEKTRLAVLGYCSSVLINSPKDAAQAFVVMDCFRDPTWNNGRSSIVMAAYEALEA